MPIIIVSPFKAAIYKNKFAKLCFFSFRHLGECIIITRINMEKDKEEILYISFNQDQTYFAIGTQKGFKVYKLSNSIELVIAREFGSGIGIV